jgi:hypothetical protein
MKTRNLLLGMACMAAFTACSNNEEPVMPAEQTRTVTIKVGIGADTRTDLAVDGVGLKRTWDSEDRLNVAFKDAKGELVVEQFNMTSGGGTTSATFEKSDSELPTSGTTKVLVWVSDREDAAVDISVQNGGFYDLSTKEWLMKETTVTDGEFSASVTLESQTIFLKIPAGTKLVNNYTGDKNVKISVMNEYLVDRYDITIDETGFGYDTPSSCIGTIECKHPATKNGELVNDCYIALMANGNITSLKIKVAGQNGGITEKVIMDKTFSSALEFGHIYNIKQSDLTLSD